MDEQDEIQEVDEQDEIDEADEQAEIQEVDEPDVECICQCWRCRREAHCGNVFFGCGVTPWSR